MSEPGALPLPEFVLRNFQTDVPDWLHNYQRDEPFDRKAFFSSRVVFYPGSGYDGQPVKLFGGTRTAHCFVYVDYRAEAGSIRAALQDASPHRFKGYTPLDFSEVRQDELAPHGWKQHVCSTETAKFNRFADSFADPYAMLVILEREADFDETHGPKRLAVLFLGADGIATFDALWCQGEHDPPYCIVVQDHGFGGNYSSFGHGGLLARLADRCNVRPDWLLVAKNSRQWSGYQPVSRLGAPEGSMHYRRRSLYRKTGAARRFNPGINP